MRGVLWFLLLGAAAAMAAIALGANDGLVTLHAGRWRVDMSLNLFLLLAAGACGASAVGWRAAHGLWKLPARMAQRRALQRERAAHAALHEALLETSAGRFTRARKAALHALALTRDSASVWPGAATARLAAAQVAADALHRLQERPERDRAIDEALQAAAAAGQRVAEEGLRLRALEWAVEDRDVERARATVAALPPGVARRTQALRLRLQLARLEGQDDEALQTARLLAKHQAFSATASEGLLRSLAVRLLDGAHDVEQLRASWQALDADERHDPTVAVHAARRAAKLGDASLARAWLKPVWDRREHLSTDERAQLAAALADALDWVGSEWVAPLEEALVAHAEESGVAVLAGLAYVEMGLWGKARTVLAQAAHDPRLAPGLRRRAWRALAAAAREAGEDQRALECEQAAARID